MPIEQRLSCIFWSQVRRTKRALCASSLLVSIGTVSISACSRGVRAQRKASSPLPSASAFGPRVELISPQADAAPPAELENSRFQVVDGPGLLRRIRESGQKGVLVNAWASWCDPCREELPMLARVAPELAARGVPIWLVSVDDPDGFPAAQALLAALHIDLPSFGAAPPLQDFKPTLNPNWPGMIPVSFLFDRTAKLRYFWAGEVYEKELLPVAFGFAQGKHIDGVSDFGLAPGATRGASHE
jgi:thiol-disulfide isomerase/thioredoxin